MKKCVKKSTKKINGLFFDEKKSKNFQKMLKKMPKTSPEGGLWFAGHRCPRRKKVDSFLIPLFDSLYYLYVLNRNQNFPESRQLNEFQNFTGVGGFWKCPLFSFLGCVKKVDSQQIFHDFFKKMTGDNFGEFFQNHAESKNRAGK